MAKSASEMARALGANDKTVLILEGMEHDVEVLDEILKVCGRFHRVERPTQEEVRRALRKIRRLANDWRD